MADATKHIPHDPDETSSIRPDARSGPAPEEEDADVPDPDADIAEAERTAGTGHYTSREKADDALKERHEEKDRRAAEDLGRGGDA